MFVVLALGAIEYLVLRWGVASLVFARTLNQKGASVGATVVLFTVGARRQIEGPVKTRVKVCCESKPYFRQIS